MAEPKPPPLKERGKGTPRVGDNRRREAGLEER